MSSICISVCLPGLILCILLFLKRERGTNWRSLLSRNSKCQVVRCLGWFHRFRNWLTGAKPWRSFKFCNRKLSLNIVLLVRGKKTKKTVWCTMKIKLGMHFLGQNSQSFCSMASLLWVNLIFTALVPLLGNFNILYLLDRGSNVCREG